MAVVKCMSLVLDEMHFFFSVPDISIDEDEEDEEQIIERRRKQREELLKVGIGRLI